MQCHQHPAGPIAKAFVLILQSGLEVGTVGHTHGSGRFLKMHPTVGRDLLEKHLSGDEIGLDLTMQLHYQTMKLTRISL